MRFLRGGPTALAALGVLSSMVAGSAAESRSAMAVVDATAVPAVGTRTLVFQDRFDGPRLDSDKWIPCYPWWDGTGCEHLVNNEQQWYWPAGDVLTGGRVELTADEHRIRGTDANGDPHWFDYVSGMATTAGRFEFTYGYVEFEARVPKGRGLWPALWMLSADCCAPEIDIMENLGQRPRKMYFTYHRDYDEPSQGTSVTGVDRGWHTYAVDWRRNAVVWYLDGVEVFRVDEAPTEPMYLLMNLAVGGDWPGPPDDGTPFPASFDVRRVRVWQ